MNDLSEVLDNLFWLQYNFPKAMIRGMKYPGEKSPEHSAREARKARSIRALQLYETGMTMEKVGRKIGLGKCRAAQLIHMGRKYREGKRWGTLEFWK